ncbi:unnamed protein product [Rangifer tarandus platyrhynchus]|uniref:Uncharacterized protein n=1 Tax=Rangifer tarandus platyrhynchus TaxID=3082113 RepID=A0ABN8ZET9_RANTA|nr:unnamed protein product [Rangifer tarandus platyrhynchus]
MPANLENSAAATGLQKRTELSSPVLDGGVPLAVCFTHGEEMEDPIPKTFRVTQLLNGRARILRRELFPLTRVKVAKSCLTVCDPMDCRLPGSSVHGISQATILEWAAISFSGGSSGPRDRTCISCVSCIDKRIV